MEITVDYREKKVYDYLKRKPYGKVLFIFDHGLGDLINFLPLYNSIRSFFPDCTFKIGVPEKRKYTKDIHRSIILLGDSFRSTMQYYQHIFKIYYREPLVEEKNSGLQKPYLCNIQEMGIPNFIWKPFKYSDFVVDLNGSSYIGVHFTGSTNPNLKNVNFEIMEKIWREIEDCGYTPFDVHMDCCTTLNKKYPDFINEENSLRFSELDISKLIESICKCNYFFGIDSGPFYLASSILGVDRCVFLKNKVNVEWYFPNQVNVIDTRKYQYGVIKRMLRKLEFSFNK
jgi:ADP-heptose:LPS heptosyltransferase